jgi:two-component system, NarL family, response regulator DegU
MEQKIEIILAEDKELFRKSLAELLKTEPTFQIVAQVENGRELIEKLKLINAHVVLLDIEMPVMDGRQALQIIRQRFTKTKVIVLSVHNEAELVSDFMARGASGYLTKDCSVEALFKAIKTVVNEGLYFDSTTSKALLHKVMDRAQHRPETSNFEEKLNERETEIVREICDGKTNKQIASALHLSTSTIDFHKGKIYSKTHCSNATELVKYALKKGIIALT